MRVTVTPGGMPGVISVQPGHEPFVIIWIVSLELCEPAAGVTVIVAEPLLPTMMLPRFTLDPFWTTIASCCVDDSDGPRHAAIAATATTTPAAITRLLRTDLRITVRSGTCQRRLRTGKTYTVLRT